MIGPSAAEIESYRFGGTRARPRKNIPATTLRRVHYLKPPNSLKTKYPTAAIAIDVQCCQDSSIHVLDVTEQVQLSDLDNCRVVIGPCVGSVLIMDCTNCVISVAAEQVRLRDVTSSELRVFAPTASECVVLETSSDIVIRAWDAAYPQLDAQFALAGWGAGATNHWARVYDFSPPADGAAPNYRLVDESTQAASRWCELSIEGSTVREVVSSQPSVEDCECPIAAADGTFYRAASEVGVAAATDSVVPVASTRTVAADSVVPAAPTVAASAAVPSASWLAQVERLWHAALACLAQPAPKVP